MVGYEFVERTATKQWWRTHPAHKRQMGAVRVSVGLAKFTGGIFCRKTHPPYESGLGKLRRGNESKKSARKLAGADRRYGCRSGTCVVLQERGDRD